MLIKRKPIKSKLSTFKRLIKNYMIILLIVSLILIILPQAIMAHTPANMELNYDFNAQQLNVTITHNVVTPNSHYIENVRVWKNDVLIIDQNYTSQPSLSTFTYTYDISSAKGDVLKVTATCSISGDITEQITIEGPKLPNIDLSVSPSITAIDEKTSQKFTITITSDNQPLDNTTITIITDEGSIFNESAKLGGEFDFEYKAASVTSDTNEKINITAIKSGYNNGYTELEFTINNIDEPDPEKPDIILTLEPPTFTQIEENDKQDFLITITGNGESLEGYSPTITANLGTISDEQVKSNGRYEFDYTAPEVDKNEAETISILVTKDGYNDGSLSLQFTILNTAGQPNQKLTLDGIISVNEYDFTAEFSNGNFKVHWIRSGDSITFGLEAKATGWVSIGFGSTVMSGSDMVIGWVDDQGSVFVIDSYTQDGSRQHPADTNQGGTDDILEFGGSENGGWTIIEFKRLLKTGDNKDQDIPGDAEIEIIWGSSNNDNFNDPHSQRGAGRLNIGTGEAEEDEVPILWPFHAILMVLGFIFMLKAIIIAHFLRKEKWWLKAHKIINSLATIFAILGLIMALYMVTEAETGHFRVPHAFLGIITIIFVIISPSLGFAQFKAGGKSGIKTAHKVFGYLTLILMLIMIISGLIQAGVL